MERSMPLAQKRLAQDTKAFWNISMAYNGRNSATTTVEKALKGLNKITDLCSRQNRLAYRAESLLEEIINNSAPARKVPRALRGKRIPSGKNTKVVERLREVVEN